MPQIYAKVASTVLVIETINDKADALHQALCVGLLEGDFSLLKKLFDDGDLVNVETLDNVLAIARDNN